MEQKSLTLRMACGAFDQSECPLVNPLVTNLEVNKPGHSRYMDVCAWIFLKDGFSGGVLSREEQQARAPLFQIVPHACVIIFISLGTIVEVTYANNLQSEKPPV